MDLKSTQLKDTYGNLLTIGTSAGSPQTGTLQNGDGEDITSLTLGGDLIVQGTPSADLFLQDTGDTDAVFKLKVNGDIFSVQSSNDSYGFVADVFQIDRGANEANFKIHNGGDISFRDGSTNEAFYWDASAGSLGIGTTNPSRELDVVGVIQAQGSFISLVSSSSTNLATSNGGNVKLTNSSATDGNFNNIGGYNSNGLVTSQINFINVSQASRTGDISFNTHNGSSLSERMRIDSSGNVGINNTSPSSFLSNGRELVLGNGSASHGMTIFSDSAGTGNLFFADGTTGDEAYRGFLRYAHSSDNMEFYTAGANLRMSIDSSGNVGIGNTSPSSYGKTTIALGASGGNVLALQKDSGAGIAFYGASFNATGLLESQNANGDMVFYTGTSGVSEKFRIYAGGNVGITTGNLILDSGAGIDFSDTPNTTATGATMTSELLDDYEEGTHDATLTCTTSGTITLNSAINAYSYTKIGRLMTVTGQLGVTSVSSPVGNIQVSLPTTIANLTDRAGRSAGCIFITNSSANVDDYFINAIEGDNFFYIQKGGSTGGSDSAQEFSGDEFITFSLSYVSA